MFRRSRKNPKTTETKYHSSEEQRHQKEEDADLEANHSPPQVSSPVMSSSPATRAKTATSSGTVERRTRHFQQPRRLVAVPVLSLLLVLLGFLLLLLLLFVTDTNNSGWWMLVLAVSLLVLLALSVVLSSSSQLHARLIAGAFCGAILCNQFPSFVSKGVAAVAIIVFGLATRPKPTSLYKKDSNLQFQTTKETKNDDVDGVDSSSSPRHRGNNKKWSGQLKAIVAAVVMTSVLLIDNFFVWVVSATYYPSHSSSHEKSQKTEPLQDNGRIVSTHLFQNVLQLSKQNVKQLRSILNVQWALVAALGATFVCCELHLVPQKRQGDGNNNNSKYRSLYLVALRAMITLSCARSIRVVSYLLTVLPSQVQDCYKQHFPPPPTDWYSWLWIGLIPNSHGGCNDLIISGHATVITVLGCACTSVASNTMFAMALWSLVAIDFMVEVYEGFHYSVDMWMGVLMTSMLWRILYVLEQDFDDSSNNQKEFYPIQSSTARDILVYAIPPAVSFCVVTMLPEIFGNYFLVIGCASALIITARQGIVQYTQHVLFCVLYVGLATYL